jgi:hypothetical protein
MPVGIVELRAGSRAGLVQRFADAAQAVVGQIGTALDLSSLRLPHKGTACNLFPYADSLGKSWAIFRIEFLVI